MMRDVDYGKIHNMYLAFFERKLIKQHFNINIISISA